MGISTLAELLRRADLRGARPRAPLRGQVLHVDPVADRRRRHRGRRRGGGTAAREGVPAPDVGRGRSRLGRRIPVAPRRRVPPVQPGRPFSSCSTRRAPGSTRSSRSTRGSSTTRARGSATLRGLHPLQGLAADRRDRRGGAGRSDRQAVLHGRDVVRLDQPGGARDARDRDEPDRREVEHRRRRRGSGALHARRQRRLAPERDQAGRLGRASASRASTW